MTNTTNNYYFFDTDPEVMRRLERVERLLGVIEDEMGKLEDAINRLERDVLDETDQIKAVELLVQSIIDTARNNSANADKLEAALNKFEANKARLAALALTNTQADPNTPVEPDPIHIPASV